MLSRPSGKRMLCKQRVEDSLQHCLACTPPIKLHNENYGESRKSQTDSMPALQQEQPDTSAPAKAFPAASSTPRQRHNSLLRQMLSFARPALPVWFYEAVTRFKSSLALSPGERPPGLRRGRTGAQPLAAAAPAERRCLPAAARAPGGAGGGTTGLPYRPDAAVPTRAHRRPGRAALTAPRGTKAPPRAHARLPAARDVMRGPRASRWRSALLCVCLLPGRQP